MPALKSLRLFKKIVVLQEDETGKMLTYTCYEAIPNGGFCVTSATAAIKENTISEAAFIKMSDKESQDIGSTFHATLIDAIKAFSTNASAS